MEQVQKLYGAGARNFLFLSVPPIQKTPSVMLQSSSTQVKEGEAVARYNGLLGRGIEAFKGNHSGVTTWVFDSTVAFDTAIKDPKSFGAKDASCYNKDGITCLWFNDYHPGQAIHKLVAQGVAALVGL
jgi:phospholipase/lecithinase/hemolysin